jgi:ketosteroid isomerase-like protein
MEEVAQAWSRLDTERALACFAPDAVYMEPPDVQLYIGHAQLRPYFAALPPGTFMIFHCMWFDEERQVGAGEYSFGREGAASADHGVAVVELRDGRIAFWREYQRKGSPHFENFIGVDGKTWQWHIGNYP